MKTMRKFVLLGVFMLALVAIMPIVAMSQTMPALSEIYDNQGNYKGPLKGGGAGLAVLGGGSTAPTISACGTSTVTGNDSAMSVVITAGTPATCAVAFGTTWSTAPICFYNDQTTANANGGRASSSTTIVTLTLPTFTGAVANFATDTVNIVCLRRS